MNTQKQPCSFVSTMIFCFHYERQCPRITVKSAAHSGQEPNLVSHLSHFGNKVLLTQPHRFT